jgi:hypothetical protein
MHKATVGISVTAPSVEFPVHSVLLSRSVASASENKGRGAYLKLKDR